MELAYWVLNNRLGGRCYPEKKALWDPRKLKEAGVKMVISLHPLEPNLIDGLFDQKIRHDNSPFRDYTAPTMETMDHINELMSAVWNNFPNKKILVHCMGGNGRTGTVLAARMIWEETVKLNRNEYPGRSHVIKALHSLWNVNPKAVETDDQLEFLLKWVDHCLRKAQKVSRDTDCIQPI